MNKEQSLERYTRGWEAWNAWAEIMLAQRTKLIETGQWFESSNDPRERGNRLTRDWFDTARADFSGHTFEENADFAYFLFPGETIFAEAMFNGSANFTKATFSDNTKFTTVTFHSEAKFTKALFVADAKFNAVAFNDNADFSETQFLREAVFEESTFRSSTEFNKIEFRSLARFNAVTFSLDVALCAKTFEEDAEFNNVTFQGNAEFDGVKFTGNAEFNDVVFTGNAGFGKTKFRGSAEFNEVKFGSNVNFERAVFEDSSSFRHVTFTKSSMFVGIKADSFFTLENAKFFSVPDFGQAHFTEAPHLHNVDFHITPVKPRRWLGLKLPGVKLNVSARWRTLRRLAIDAHDHEREMNFFAEEIKSLRGVQDRLLPNPLNLLRGKPIWRGGGRYWAGLLYEAFSDFGRSTLRPFLWWVFFTIIFMLYYLSPHLIPLDQGNNSKVIPNPMTLTCLSEAPGNPLKSAVYLSVQNGLVISGLGRSEKIAQSYACLYGSNGEDQLVPIMPDPVVYAGIAQSMLSAALIFLFVLALRNYFRIK